MKTSLAASTVSAVRSQLITANAGFLRVNPGDSGRRQPVHTVYGGAHLFRSDTARKMGEVGLRTLREHAPDAEALARGVGAADVSSFGRVYERVVAKLTREAVEDFRIDFEDGYGNRSDAEEDGHADQAARELAKGLTSATLPPFIGIRIKSFSDELFGRSSRTLDVFLTSLAEAAPGRLPDHFVVTLPKVTLPAQVGALVDLLSSIEKSAGFPEGAIGVELMIETPQAILGEAGAAPLRALVAAGQGRVQAAHFGTYDYTALCGITSAHQSMTHLSCDFAKNVMQVSLAGSGIMLSDGATTVLPIGPHRAAAGGSLTPAQLDENREAIHRAWRLAYANVRHSLETGYYQGWDLHPAQLPVRYAAVYAFFLEGVAAASSRLKAFMDKAAQATLLGDVFDDAATGQGLLNFFLRGLACGALTEEEARGTALSPEEIRTRSFLKILEGRKRR